MGSLSSGGWVRVCAAALLIALVGLAAREETAHASGAAQPASPAHAADAAHVAETVEPRRQPMTFVWHPAPKGRCAPDCRDWIEAVGVITSDTPALFEKTATGHDLSSATVVLNSSGGSVLDALALGRVWRKAGIFTTVGRVIETDGLNGKVRAIQPDAYCESMCVFLLLAGNTRTVPPEAHVRVHQIWMGDRANDAKAATYTAQDLMIVERDVGRLAKYTFDMGGTGDLLTLALSVPPWEPLHELSRAELRLGNLVTDEPVVADAPKLELPHTVTVGKPVVTKPIQDRVATVPAAMAPTKTAEALPPTGGAAAGQ
ncbi:hypothetical protein AFIC_001281 [[Pseudomonas] carboxydohydrogena]|uniref:Uncharacterized protein n=1 Tax=Afipia carboxydohydrogena TaxID=290 RepID=A0ABY8BWI5_AFICR|nr:hypothetical protein [[Pseudomonas] carboxydohydrogena]WEF52782.1 hypothetical protein AFIC_001281 [[Pseudomonas] carboxydohydrogena]